MVECMPLTRPLSRQLSRPAAIYSRPIALHENYSFAMSRP